jgi:undecaprenyl-diphosphatase
MIQRFAHYYAQRFTPYEVIFMQGLCSLRRHAWLTRFLYFLSRMGDGLLWWISGLLFLIVGTTRTCWAVLAAGGAIGISVSVFILVKKWVGRPRPFEKWCDISSLIVPPDKFSFPSGHTMTAFSVYAVYSSLIPGSGVLFLPIAILLGISRVFLGVHYPTDVVVGALLGVGIGKMTVLGFSLIVL